MLEILGELQEAMDLAELREALVPAIRAVIPSDWTSLNAIGPTPGDVWFLSIPSAPPEHAAAFRRLAHQNPLVSRLQRTRDGRAYRFSDVLPQAQLHQLQIYRELYAPLGVEHQIAFTLPSPRGHVLGVALSRSGHDFTDLERDVLNRARPFLIQLYRNAMALTALRASAEQRRPESVERRLSRAGLTRREAEVVRLVAEGRSNQQIADRLTVSVRTVHKHLENAFRKLGVRSRSEAAAQIWAVSA